MSKKMPWPELNFWNSGEWQVVEERLNDLRKKRVRFCPEKDQLFRALYEVPFDEVKVCLLGQDPYPNPEHATGIAFSVNDDKIPPTLKIILKEYETDLHHTAPKVGDLTKWCSQGVLLWNVYPSCEAYKSMSHEWSEWEQLTGEILTQLSQETSCIFAALGSIPQRILKRYVNGDDSYCLYTGHPSPRGNAANSKKEARNTFTGSRIFTTINSKLVEQGTEPINWRL